LAFRVRMVVSLASVVEIRQARAETRPLSFASRITQSLRVLLRSWLTRACPPRLLLLALLLPALGTQLLIAHDAAKALTSTQLRPAASTS